MGKKFTSKSDKNKTSKSESNDKSEQEILQPASEPQQLKPIEKISIFSDSMKKKFHNFQDFYVQYVNHRVGNSEMEEELSQMSGKLNEQIENVCTGILKKELSEAEEWIRNQQVNINKEIEKIDEAYENSKKNLSETGCFENKEIDQNLNLILAKKEEKKGIIKEFDSLIDKSKAVYEWKEKGRDEE